MSDQPVRSKGRGPLYEVGQLVVLKSDSSKCGAVIGVNEGDREHRYQVFFDGRPTTVYESMLSPAEAQTEGELLPLTEFKARLSAIQINQPSLTNLYSLHAARINFIPYQFRPVLKFIRADRPRLLIADEVGVGKTIEAGLILRELQARRDVRSVLIVCPKPLVTERKWQQEMARFDESFIHLDGPTLRHCIAETNKDGEWPESHARCILPFSLLNDERNLLGEEAGGRRGELGLLNLNPPPRFDLVIVDEAHHLRSTATNLHQGVAHLVESADAAVFLTATPIQLESDDLYVLLKLLRPDVVFDRGSFAAMSEPNVFLNEATAFARAAYEGWQEQAAAALSQAASTDWGQSVLGRNPGFQSIFRNVSQGTLSQEDRLSFIRSAEELHTFAHLINRTRRRDVGEFTTRKPQTVSVPFTPSQQALHDALLAAQERILMRAHGVRSVRFLMTTLRRQAASCLYGLAPLIERILYRRMGIVELDEVDPTEEVISDDAVATIREDIESVLSMAGHLDERDPKFEALSRVVVEKQQMPNNKLLMFSSFRHTLSYVERRLRRDGVRVALIHGEVPDEERRELRDRFSLPREDERAVDVLLSSEVGCEGLDYQFCDGLVNLDLPWNPARIEQRIGRIDRYGQRSQTVAIYNLVTPGTVDYDIYDRCLWRIGVFQRALGASEEILGSINDELRSVAESLELTTEERQARLQQVADNAIRFAQEQQRLEDEQAQLFGILLPPEQIEREVADATSAWLTPSAIENLVRSYLLEFGAEEAILGESGARTLRLNQEARARILEDYQKLPRKASPIHRQWERYLQGGEPRQAIAFDSDAASHDRSAAFITPVHPLAQQAAKRQTGLPPFRTALSVTDASLPPGRYPFSVYLWQKKGIVDDSSLQTISSDPRIAEAILTLLAQRDCCLLSEDDLPADNEFDELERRHHEIWERERRIHRQRTEQIARFRRESLRISHEATMGALSERSVSDPKIRRMLNSQMANLEAGHLRRLSQVDEAERRSEILFDRVAIGVLLVEALK